MADSDLLQGVLPDHGLEALARSGAITSATAWDGDQFQPASLDLRLGRSAYRVRASFLPGAGRTVAGRLGLDAGPSAADLSLHAMSLDGGAVLETGCVYLVPLQEALDLPGDVGGLANPKSSTGRIDVFVRIITDGARAFDRIATGYSGPLWAEISPRTFPIRIRPGERLAQLRLRRGRARPTTTLDLGLDLDPASIGPIVGYRARRHAPLLDLSAIGAHDPQRWFEPIPASADGLVLDPGEFYILASTPNVEIGPDLAAEMVPTAEDLGEFRAHYAGFFDPGFGHGLTGNDGRPRQARAVLEVRGRDVPFVLEHGQNVARLVHEPLAAPPSVAYGQVGSHYQGQGLKLSKLFKPWPG